MGFFDALSQAIYHEEGVLLELFEVVHYAIFFVMTLFVFQVWVLVREAIETEHMWVEMDRLALLPRDHYGIESAKSDEQKCFEALREEFILDREAEPPFSPTPTAQRVPEDFPFGRYLGICLGCLLAETVEVSDYAWYFFSVGAIGYFGVCVLVNNTEVVVWMWIGVGWSVLLFNAVFERHLLKLRDSFVAREPALPDGKQEKLLDLSLPGWCHVNLEAYMASRSWLYQCVVGGVPNRQQSLYWMDQKGPTYYLIIQQINLIFAGIYSAVHVLSFIGFMAQKPFSVFIIYLVLATLPILGFILNKQHLVATMSQVCCMGVYRRTHAVNTVLREIKTERVVRSFLSLYKLRQIPVARASTEGRRKSFNPMQSREIFETFRMLDRKNEGHLSRDDIGELMSNLGASMDEDNLQIVVEQLDKDGDGSISQEEFAQWYRDNAGRDDEMSNDDRALALFSMFDEDGSGEINTTEFKAKLDALEVGLSVDDVVAIMNEFDTDHSGTLTIDEFAAFFHKHYPRELAEQLKAEADMSERRNSHLSERRNSHLSRK